MTSINPTLFFVVAIFVFCVSLLYLLPIGLWFSATVSGVRISLMKLLLMRLRRSPVTEIVKGLIVCVKGGVPMQTDLLEAHALAGGNVRNVALGLVAAHQAGLDLSFKKATAADFKGIDLVEAVRAEAAKRQKEEKLFE